MNNNETYYGTIKIINGKYYGWTGYQWVFMGYAPKDLGSRPGDIGYDSKKQTIADLEVYHENSRT